MNLKALKLCKIVMNQLKLNSGAEETRFASLDFPPANSLADVIVGLSKEDIQIVSQCYVRNIFGTLHSGFS